MGEHASLCECLEGNQISREILAPGLGGEGGSRHCFFPSAASANSQGAESNRKWCILGKLQICSVRFFRCIGGDGQQSSLGACRQCGGMLQWGSSLAARPTCPWPVLRRGQVCSKVHGAP